jgi:hypothetical protein
LIPPSLAVVLTAFVSCDLFHQLLWPAYKKGQEKAAGDKEYNQLQLKLNYGESAK